MSLWWREQWRVRLAPDLVSVRRRSHGPRRRDLDVTDLEVTQSAGRPDWRAAVAAFFAGADAAGRRGAALEIVLSGHFVHYLLLPTTENLSAQDLRAYALHELQSLFGADAMAWTFCVGHAAAGLPRVVAATETALIEELRAQCAPRGLHLHSVRPLLDAAAAALPAGTAAPDGWLATVEPGRLSVCRLEHGRCMSVRSASYSGGHEEPLLTLLEQDALCAGVATQSARLYLQSDRALNCDLLRARGWQVLPSVLQ